MLNKKQIRLKTVQASNWIDPKQQIFLQFVHSPPKKSPKPTLTTQIYKKLRMKTERKEEDGSIKKIVLKNLSKSQVSHGGKANLQKFPKRQYPLKNGNPYRYFINSRKLLTEPSEQQNEFFIKMDKIIHQTASRYVCPFSIRRHSTESCHQKNRKTTELVFKQTKTSRITGRYREGHEPEPWVLREEQVDEHFC